MIYIYIYLRSFYKVEYFHFSRCNSTSSCICGDILKLIICGFSAYVATNDIFFREITLCKPDFDTLPHAICTPRVCWYYRLVNWKWLTPLFSIVCFYPTFSSMVEESSLFPTLPFRYPTPPHPTPPHPSTLRQITVHRPWGGMRASYRGKVLNSRCHGEWIGVDCWRGGLGQGDSISLRESPQTTVPEFGKQIL